MRKDVKRSLILWPLVSSIVVIGLCFIAIQGRTLTSRFLVGSGQSIVSGGGEKLVQSALGNSKSTATKQIGRNGQTFPSSQSGVEEAPAGSRIGDGVGAIRGWLDAPIEIPKPSMKGIPAPKLDSMSDLFGFEARPIAGETEWKNEFGDSVLEDVSNSIDFNDLVIELDDALFDDDATDAVGLPEPLELNHPDVGFSVVEPRLAERPTNPTARPNTEKRTDAYQAPISALADLEREEGRNIKLDEVLLPSPNEEMRRSAIGSLGDQSAEDVAIDLGPEVEDKGRVESQQQRELADARWATWPNPKRLVDQLETLKVLVEQEPVSQLTSANYVSDLTLGAADVVSWCDNVRSMLDELHHQTRLGDDVVGGVLDELGALQRRAAIEAETVASRSQRVAWLQAAYSLERRLSVWNPIYRINSGDFPANQYVGDDAIKATTSIARLQDSLDSTGDAEGWRVFLLLDELQRSFTSGDDRYRRELTQKFLARLRWPGLTQEHQDWLNGDLVIGVARAVRPWACGAVDYSALLHQIEKTESNAIDLVTAEIAQAMVSLQYAKHEEARKLAAAIDTHYRNANVRFSLSDRFLEGILPKIPNRSMPLRTTVLGSRVTGVSDVSSELGIRLIPSSRSWEMQLETIGQVSTRSIGRSGPASFRTSSVNPYNASTPISIKPTDIQLGNASVDVLGRTRLQGVETTYDGWPLIGSFVRSIAENEYFERSSLSNRIARGRIRSELSSEIASEINGKVEDVSQQFSQSVLGPLNALQLQPRVIDMQTTEDRMIARYRMAGESQLAATTPRPRALAGNLFSVQLHQSALNNTLEQLVPQDELMPIQDVLTSCYNVLGIDSSRMPEDLPDDVSIQFARHRPMTIEIEDGKVWITMRIIRLNRDRLKLRNFIVRAAYRPQFDGLKASLVREGSLNISGPRMSMRQRLPVRTVFTKVLSPNRPLPLLDGEMLQKFCPPDAGVIQFELRDGWLGLAIGTQTRTGTIARRPTGIR
ncbi:MAG: hypothetical protein AAF802_15060 [Planctomycetota bacterium]